MLRATTACTFRTSQLPKLARNRQFFTPLTWTRASRHNCVHFFDSSTSKSGLRMVGFVHFDLEMWFAPQQRALFRHLNFEKCSEGEVFLPFTSTCAWRHNGIQFFIAYLARWLRTRCFSKPTFRPSGATNHWKNTLNRDFSTFSRTYLFFLLILSPP